MILTSTERFFVRLLRSTVIFTAACALAVTVIGLMYAGYAWFQPEPKAHLSSKVTQFREATDPALLIKQMFPQDSAPYKDATSTLDKIAYERKLATTQDIFGELNKFLDAALSAGFDNQKTFEEWLFGGKRIPFSWDSSIDDKTASNEDSVDVLWRSLFLDYAKRLHARAQSLRNAREQKLFPSAFDKLTAPTGQAAAPYFVVWYFSTLQDQLRSAKNDLDTAQFARNALRLTAPIGLAVAGGAFTYFVTIMFLFFDGVD